MLKCGNRVLLEKKHFYPSGESTLGFAIGYFVKAGEYREPKRGEYFLSGAIVQAYKAPNDLSQKYDIAKKVNVKRYELFEIID